MPHLDPDRLVLIALGEQDPSTPETEHLHTCRTCSVDLDAMRSTVGLGRETQHLRDLPAPADDLWDRIAGTAFSTPSPNGTAKVSAADLQRAAAGAPVNRRSLGFLRRGRLTLAAAAAVLLIAVAGIVIWWPGGRDSQRIVAEADLLAQPAAPAAAHGRATIIDTGHGLELRLTMSGMPAATGYYTVWLYDGRTVMIPIGSPGSAPLNVPAAADDLTTFSIIDVSAQRLGQQQHGTSMLQGRLHSRR